MSLTTAMVQAQCVFEEKDGLIVIEAEEMDIPSTWHTKTEKTGYTGSGYITWEGGDNFSKPDVGTITTKFKITKTGIYSFQWRNAVGEGTNTTEFNDSWLKFPDATDFYGQKGNDVNARVYPKGSGKTPLPEGAGSNGWFKIYTGGTTDWNWKSNTSDNDAHAIYVEFATPGEYTMLISGRSELHAIDRIVLSNEGVAATNLATSQSACVGDNNSADAGKEISTPSGVVLSGELRRWHKTTLTCDGPNTSEDAATNPFTNYRLDATFTHTSGKSIVVPGYYASCGNAEEGCATGNKWKVHFAPNLIGDWSYTLAFTTGNNVAVNGGGSSAGFIDGKSGSFSIGESDKSGRDFRAADKGQLKYVGEHYLQFAGTGGDNPNGNFFVKAGADAPENMLAYVDFDDTPNRGNRRKSWTDHQQDYIAADASEYTWQNGKGTELLGVVNYLSERGVNAFSFLTLSLHGDDENVFPYLMKVNESTYNGYNDSQQWSNGVHHDRFDNSKLAQWERIFEYGDKRGMFMHFKTLETENDNIMDNDNFGNERKLYYRELIARFSHHMAMNWNLTEESTLKDVVVQETSAYLKAVDPYDHHRVLHTYPSQQAQRYNPQLGNNSELTGASIQTDKSNVHADVLTWVKASANAGKKWVVANDEQGSANIGVDVDGKDDQLVREEVLWGTLLAGGMGVEYYYGYQTDPSDLTAESHRNRQNKYNQAGYALRFFEENLLDHLIYMNNDDAITADNSDFAFVKENEIVVVYRPNGGTTNITLPTGDWSVQWFNPRAGGSLTTATGITSSITAPDNNDWVAFVTNGEISGGGNKRPTLSFSNPSNGDSYFEGGDLGVTVVANDEDGTVANVKLYLNNTLVRQEATAPYDWGTDNAGQTDAVLLDLAQGTYTLKAIVTDNEGATSEASITIEVVEKGLLTLSTVNDAYLQGVNETNFNTEDLRIEANNRLTYIMFDISSVTADVLRSELQMSVGTDAGNGTINVYQVANGWAETSVNGSNKPTKLNNVPVATFNSTYALGQMYTFDLSDVDFSGDQVSFILEMENGGNDVSFASKESNIASGPQLIIKMDETITSNKSVETTSLRLFPNPTKGDVFLSEIAAWRLSSIDGKLLEVGSGNKIEINKFQKGVYLLQFNGTTIRLIKE